MGKRRHSLHDGQELGGDRLIFFRRFPSHAGKMVSPGSIIYTQRGFATGSEDLALPGRARGVGAWEDQWIECRTGPHIGKVSDASPYKLNREF